MTRYRHCRTGPPASALSVLYAGKYKDGGSSDAAPIAAERSDAGGPSQGATAMSAQGRIEINPKVMLGKPVISGTRITVELILRKLGEGATPGDLLVSYPHLSEDDIQAAIRYAADTVAHEETVLVDPKA